MPEELIYRDRRGTEARKWNYLKKTGFAREDLLGMWVADMDFAAPECVREALKAAADYGVFGYDAEPEEYYTSFIRWEEMRHGFRPEREWLRFCPGVVTGFYWLVRILTEPGDAVLIQTPVYYPFMSAVEEQGRRLVRSELVNDHGVYTVDYDALERDVEREGVRAMILCSPHNPVGRVWTRAELSRLLSICRRHGVAVISDEIHQDFTHGGCRHTPTASLAEENDIVCTLTAPSKTFNLAGLQNAVAILPNGDVRAKFDAHMREVCLSGGNSMGFISAAAAYTGGADWLEAVNRQVESNAELLRAALEKGLPNAVMSPLEGTYLAWVDLTGYVEPEAMKETMELRCGLALDYGTQFGGNAPCHIRINLATSAENVRTAADALIRELG